MSETVKNLREAKIALESRIAFEISAAVKEFESVYGSCVNSVTVECVEVTTFDSIQPQHIVGRVSVGIEI